MQVSVCVEGRLTAAPQRQRDLKRVLSVIICSHQKAGVQTPAFCVFI
jgi:hypothetical protein